MALLTRSTLLLSSSASLLLGLGGTAMAQSTPAAGVTKLPGITVVAPRVSQQPRRPKTRVTNAQRRETPAAPAAPTPEQVEATANRQVVQQTQNFDQRRDNVLLPKAGASTYELTQRDIENIPQGNAAQLSDIALQFPGVSQDSTSAGDFHIRNEHAN